MQIQQTSSTFHEKTLNHNSAPNFQLKKNCLAKKRLQNLSSKQQLQCQLSHYFHIYNIIYIDLNHISDTINNNSLFLQGIFKFQTVSKVYKNRNQIVLSMKLCPKLAKTQSNMLNHKSPFDRQKDNYMEKIDFSRQNKNFSQLFQKIHSTLHKYKDINQIKQNEQIKRQIFLTQEEVERRTEKILRNRNFQKYIVFENVFLQNCKKIKKIHFSNTLIQSLGYMNETIAFEILQKRNLPFKIFKQFNYKKYGQNVICHFSKVLNKYFSMNQSKTMLEQQIFQMRATIVAQNNIQKEVNLKWRCSHPSIILTEIVEEQQQCCSSMLLSEKVINEKELCQGIQKLRIQ